MELQQELERIKTDKSIIQPWRNKAVSAILSAQAYIKMGRTTTYPFFDEKPATGASTQASGQITNGLPCTCMAGVVDNGCLVHGK